VSTAIDRPPLDVDTPSFCMWYLLFIDEESMFAGITPKMDAR
jgi:hypothetical protein